MKLIIITKTNPFFENSASANRWRTLIEGLLHLNVRIELLITGGYNTKKESVTLGSFGEWKGLSHRYVSKLIYYTLWWRRMNKYILEPLLANSNQKKVIKYISRNQDAIVWTNSAMEGFKVAYSIKKKYPRVKTFLEMSEFLDVHLYNLGNKMQMKEGNERQTFFEEKAIFSFSGLALMTRTLYNYYSNLSGNIPKLLHLPMTVDLDRFSNHSNDTISKTLQRPYIAFVGVMNNQKDGVNILIDAFAKIVSQFPKLNLYLFGSYNYDTPGHLEQIKKLNLSEKVFYKGEVNRDKIPSILLNAALLVLPRPDSKQAQGGFPTKLGEYLASGTPVCATKVGELQDYLKDNESVFFAEPGSIDSFANAILQAMNHPTHAYEVGQNGKKVAETYFNKDIQSKLLFDFLKQL